MDKLTQARKRINEVDAEMAKLFCRRMEAVKDVLEYKREHGPKHPRLQLFPLYQRKVL